MFVPRSENILYCCLLKKVIIMARKTRNSSVKEEPKEEVIDVEDESAPAVFVAPRSSAQSCVMILPGNFVNR